MSVVNEFKARRVAFSEESRTIYIVDSVNAQMALRFTFHCKADHNIIPVQLFFDLKTYKCLMVTRSKWSDSDISEWRCWQLGFSIVDNLPLLSAKIFMDQHLIINMIAEDFQDKLASYIIDQAIQS
jgi:hypothetical protein